MAFPHRFFFELMIKSMIEHLARTGSQDSLRKMRFSHQYCDDIQNLTSSITNDIIAHNIKDVRDTRVRMPSLILLMPLIYILMYLTFIHLSYTNLKCMLLLLSLNHLCPLTSQEVHASIHLILLASVLLTCFPHLTPCDVVIWYGKGQWRWGSNILVNNNVSKMKEISPQTFLH